MRCLRTSPGGDECRFAAGLACASIAAGARHVPTQACARRSADRAAQKTIQLATLRCRLTPNMLQDSIFGGDLQAIHSYYFDRFHLQLTFPCESGRGPAAMGFGLTGQPSDRRCARRPRRGRRGLRQAPGGAVARAALVGRALRRRRRRSGVRRVGRARAAQAI